MIKENIQQIKSEIGSAELVTVSKSRTVDEIKIAIDSGASIIAENRIQEAEQKYAMLKDYFEQHNIEYHFIGHLQTNKAKKAVQIFDLIQSVDSLKLAKEIDKRARQINKIQDILVEVNIGKEPQKYGIMPDETLNFVKEISNLENIVVKGLMCMPPLHKNPRPYFKEMKKTYDNSKLEILSMGMSNDYKIAIEEGSTMIRIGTLIFGERKY